MKDRLRKILALQDTPVLKAARLMQASALPVEYQSIIDQLGETVSVPGISTDNDLAKVKLLEQSVGLAGVLDLALAEPNESLSKLVASLAGTGIASEANLEQLRLNAPKIGLLDTLDRYDLKADYFRRFALGITIPEQLESLNFGSITALAEIQGIGNLVNTLPSFDEDLAQVLRVDLGDWRQPLKVDFKALLDPIIRTEFYVSQGLARELVELPETTFRSGMSSAGLNYVEEVSEEESSETTEDDFQRTNEAHNQLMRFEYELRQFVFNLMTNAHGTNWVKQRVPGEILGKWKQKKRSDTTERATSQPLIAYAELGDLSYPLNFGH
ncbi:hypothetical protein [Leisingera sp. JC1]|uniref:hypothetical protein n=1 Tax=Leisingera sp. JC1 TaxID=1855282 RepID=UPI001131B259|nr:hypothetical protein [Leisingera sp. JC1]